MAIHKILIIDPDKHSRQKMVDVLTKNGFEPHAYASFSSAKKALSSNGYLCAVVGFLDSSNEQITSVNEIKKTLHLTPIILHLNSGITNHTIKLFNIGIFGVLEKDFKSDELMDLINQAVLEYQTSHQLAIAQKKYEQLFSSLMEGVVSVDLYGNILECNQAYEKITGYSLNELKHLTFWDLTPPKWHESDKEIIQTRLFPNGTSGVYEKEYIHKDGFIVPIEINAFITLDNHGYPVGMWAYVRDISRRKIREEKTKKRQDQIIQQQKALIEFSKLTAENLDASLKIITEKIAESINVQRVSIWRMNHERNKLICIDMYHKDHQKHHQGEEFTVHDYPLYFSAISESRIVVAHDAVNDPSTAELKENYLEPNKITSLLDCHICLHGELVGVLCIEHTGPQRVWTLEEQNFGASTSDIIALLLETSERLRTENELIKSEERYRYIFESATVAMLELDFSKVFEAIRRFQQKHPVDFKDLIKENPNFLIKIFSFLEITDVNQSAFDLYECHNKKEMIGSFSSILTSDSLNTVYQALEAILSEKSFFEGETIIRTIHGKQKSVYFRMKLPGFKSKNKTTLINIMDISSRKQVEEDLLKKIKELTVLHGITTAGTESRHIDELIERTTRILGETLFPNNFGVMIVDEESQTIFPHPSYHGISKEAIQLHEPLNKGITGRAVRTQKVQRVANVMNDEDYLEINSDTRSELSVPVIVNGKVIWVINTESNFVDAFSETDEQLLITFANQLSLALERMQLSETQQRQTREITALYETAISTSGVLDSEKLLNRIFLQVTDLFPLDTFMVVFYEEDTEEIHIAAAMEENRILSEWIDQHLPLKDSGLIGWVINNQKSLLIRDMKTNHLPVKPIAISKPVRSWLGVPLTTHGQTIGAISVQSFQPYVYDENHSRLLESMAAQIATALDNARLIEQTQSRIQRLAALHDIDLVINSSLDLRVTLNILLDQVIEKLGVTAAAVMLLNPQTQQLEYSAGRGFKTRNIENYSLRLGEGLSGQAAMERHLVQALNLSELDENTAYPSLLSDEGFLSYYSVPLIAKGQVKGVLDIFNRDILTPDQEWVNFLETLAGQAAIAIDNTSLLEDLHRSNIELTLAYDTTLEGWSRALDLRDKETEGHTQRVVDITLKIAHAFGMSDSDLIHLRRGALLHDIGKMGIPDEILFKPGPLSPEEWVIMHRHPVLAHDLLSPISHLRPAVDIPYCHHEKWDGTGYPRGLKGEQIPLPARIFTVVDVWDALTSDRPYRKAWPAKKALEFIATEKGKHFDPKVVDLFLILIKNELNG